MKKADIALIGLAVMGVVRAHAYGTAHCDLLAFSQIPVAVVAQFTPGTHSEKINGVILAPPVNRHGECSDLFPGLRCPVFRVCGEIADYHQAVHDLSPFSL